MDLSSPDTWCWLWIVFAFIFVIGELVSPATFFFLPFAIGAAIAAALSFANFAVPTAWTVFLVSSIVIFAALWRVGRRLEHADSEQEGVGSTRWVGAEAIVESDIESNGFGTVRLDREQWRAQSLTGDPIKKGSTVLVTKLAGVALTVVPVEEPEEI
jgi:membrane protein implicated in regulation of membrane protease activity